MHINRRKKRIAWTAVILLLGMGSAAFALIGRHQSPEMGKRGASSNEDQAINVKTIRPKRDVKFQVTSHHVAAVEPYYQADLRARASGTVSSVTKAIEQRVRHGEVLVEIDVPDLREDVLVKRKEIEQQQREVQKVRDEIKIAMAHVDVAKANVELRRREVGLAIATRDLRKKRLERYRELLAKEAIVPDVFDEQERDWKVAVAAVDVAEGAVLKALADQKEMEASLAGKSTDIYLKETLVEVARHDLARAEAFADYARVVAPFDGVITKRNVNPGAFVQNATSGSSQPLLTVSRLDMVTVFARVPDNVAAFVGVDTIARITLDTLPGVIITGRVTRKSGTVDSNDRTMRVEVDLYNDSDEAYATMKREVAAGLLSALASRSLFETIPLLAGGRAMLAEWQKSPGDPVPIAPRSEVAAAFRPILPGTSGIMELVLNRDGVDAYLIPSSAVYSINGKPYILVVKDGMSVQVPVRVQVDDGAIAKVDTLVAGGRDSYRELTGAEEIIASRQIEIGHGRRVKPVLSEWVKGR